MSTPNLANLMGDQSSSNLSNFFLPRGRRRSRFCTDLRGCSEVAHPLAVLNTARAVLNTAVAVLNTTWVVLNTIGLVL